MSVVPPRRRLLAANVERARLERDIDGLVELEALSFERPWTRQMLLMK